MKLEDMFKLIREWKDQVPGGKADKDDPDDFDQEELKKGEKVEREHTDDPKLAKEIAMDHEKEFPNGKYYKNLDDMEKKMKKEKKRG